MTLKLTGCAAVQGERSVCLDNSWVIICSVWDSHISAYHHLGKVCKGQDWQYSVFVVLSINPIKWWLNDEFYAS